MIGIAWVLVVVLGLVPPLLREAHTDIAWPFYLAEQILSGARQGVDFLEVNPPLFLWLSMPSIVLERWTGIGAWQFNVLFTALLALASLLITNRLLSPLVPEMRRRRVLLLAAGFAALVLPRISFAQREHLAYLATLPYGVLIALRLGGLTVPAPTSVLVGALGGLGFALKPHFLIAWLLLELLCLTRLGVRAARRPELGALVVFGALYLVAVVLFVPDYLAMALRLRPWYDRYINNGIAVTAILAGPALLLTVLIALAQRAATREEDSLASALCMAFLGFLAAAIIQKKGFNYHWVAASSFGLVLVIRGWQVLEPRVRLRPSVLLAQSGVLLALFVVTQATTDAVRELADPGANRYRTDPNYPLLLPVVKQLAGGQPMVVLSSNPAMGWPLARDAHTTWASRYMSLWPLPALYDRELWTKPFRIVRPRDAKVRSDFEREFRNEVIEDLLRWRPRLIVIPIPDSTVSGWGGAFRIDYLEYFNTDPRFREFMREFVPADSVGPYQLWLRREH